MLSEYGVDLREIFSENPPDPKWLLTLAINLPIASSFTASRRGGQEYRHWGPEAYHRTQLIDAINQVGYILVMIHRDPDKRTPTPPAPTWTPGSNKQLPDDKRTDFKPGSVGAMLQQAKRNKMKRMGLL